MEDLLRNVRYAVRGLRNSPGFAPVAVTTLALGIGVNSTIFSIVNAVLLRPLPVQQPAQLVDIYGHTSNSDSHDTTSYLDYLDLRQQTETLSGLVAYSNFFANLAYEGRSELVVGELVSDNYFDVLGIQPGLGRAFTPEEFETEGTHPVTILSHTFWRTRFAADPGVLGSRVRINGTPYTVVGVAGATFGGMFPAVTAQMWVPVAMVEEVEPLVNQRGFASAGDTRLQRRAQRWLWLRGRMQPDTSVAEVQAELEGITARLAVEYPDTNDLETVTVMATNDVYFNPDFDTTLVPAGLLILAISGLVLLVACANLANMLLARAAGRRREIAVRLAIGAGRGQLVRQLLTESVVLALLGGGVGLLFADWSSRLIARFQPPVPIDLGVDFSVDWRVLTFTLIAAAVTGIAFGLVPALRASRPDVVGALKDADASERLAGHGFRLRDALVVIQVAVSIVLLVAGALMMRSLAAAQRIELGFDADRISFLGLAMEMNGYDNDTSAVFFDSARARLQDLPGVQSVTLMSRVPLSLNDNNFGLFIDGHQTAASDRPYLTGGAYVNEHYFSTLELTIIHGRPLDGVDMAENRRVTVVTEAMAGRYWPDESAVGKSFRTSWEGQPVEIVGVVEDYKVNSPGESPTPYVHMPYPRRGTFGNFMVRTAGPAAAEVLTHEAELRRIDPDLVFLDAGPTRKLVDTRLFAVRTGAWLIGAFGSLALLLAAVELYGVISYSVSRRTREMGIRVALGADPGRLVSLVVRQGMTLLIVGGLIGALMAALTGRLLASVLFVSPIDPLSFGVAFGILATVATLANWVPARRASRVDPMVALRSE